jgi:lambda repressor-like predicted transcriptional regulator
MSKRKWTYGQALEGFLGGESLKALSRRLGGSVNTIKPVLLDRLGEERFAEIRDRNDPKRSTASRADILAAFHTEQAFKKVSASFGMSPNTLRSLWVAEFGQEAFDARSKRFHSAAGTKVGLSRKGQKRVTPEQLRERAVARGADHWCPVCDAGCVGYQALTHHMVRAGDEEHVRALAEIRERFNYEGGFHLPQDTMITSIR